MGLQINVKVNWQQIEKIPLQHKVAGLLGLCALIGGLFFYFAYLPKTKQLAVFESRLVTAERAYNEKKAIADNLPTFQEEVRKLNEKLELALAKLPNTADIDKILIDLPTLAKEEELIVRSFKPGNSVAQGFYASVPISLALTGTYNRLARFFEKIGKLNRIISVGDIKLDTAAKDTSGQTSLTATVSATTYTFVDSAASAPEQGAKHKKGSK